jgi:hypothetical protein
MGPWHRIDHGKKYSHGKKSCLQKKNQPWKNLANDFHYNLQELKTFQRLDHIPRLPNAHHLIA